MSTVSGDGPSVSMSFANNFWGKGDAGYGPLIERMANSKQTNDELKAFYNGTVLDDPPHSVDLLTDNSTCLY